MITLIEFAEPLHSNVLLKVQDQNREYLYHGDKFEMAQKLDPKFLEAPIYEVTIELLYDGNRTKVYEVVTLSGMTTEERTVLSLLEENLLPRAIIKHWLDIAQQIEDTGIRLETGILFNDETDIEDEDSRATFTVWYKGQNYDVTMWYVNMHEDLEDYIAITEFHVDVVE